MELSAYAKKKNMCKRNIPPLISQTISNMKIYKNLAIVLMFYDKIRGKTSISSANYLRMIITFISNEKLNHSNSYQVAVTFVTKNLAKRAFEGLPR